MKKLILFFIVLTTAIVTSCSWRADPDPKDGPSDLQNGPSDPQDESSGQWLDYTSDSYWGCLSNCGGWDGTQWTELGPGMALVTAAESTWQQGFRPTKVRVTYSAGGPATIDVGLYPGGIDFGSGNIASEEELDLNVTSDIVRINLYETGTVSKIEFYEE